MMEKKRTFGECGWVYLYSRSLGDGPEYNRLEIALGIEIEQSQSEMNNEENVFDVS